MFCVLGSSRLDVNHKAKAAIESKKVSFASKEEAEDITLQTYGGISPLGLPEEIKIFVDENGFLLAAPQQQQNHPQQDKPVCCGTKMYHRERFQNRAQSKTLVCLKCGNSETFFKEKLDDRLTELYRRMAKNAA